MLLFLYGSATKGMRAGDMNITRRQFVAGTAGGLLGAAFLAQRNSFAAEGIKVSACDWSLGATGPGGLEVAKQVGLNGLEISAGDPAKILPVADPALRQQYKEAIQKTGIVVSSIAMGFLNNNPLATEADGVAWMEQTIESAQDIGAKVILVAFFGKGDLLDGKKLKPAEVDAVVEKVKAAAPKAAAAGVILGLENTLSAKDNLAILDRIQNDAVRVYYDCGNSTFSGYNVPEEIKMLGDRICQIHFKDGGHYLGEGKVDMKAAAAAIKSINYKGWFVLETSAPSKDKVADFKRNAEYVRNLGLA